MSIFRKSKKERNKKPEICLSLNCATMTQIYEEIDRYKDYCSVVEWCVDKFPGAEQWSQEEFAEKLAEVKQFCKGKKLMVDYKGDEKVGNAFLRRAMGIADIIDIDADNSEVHKLVRQAKRKGTQTLISHHEFEKMPGRDEIATLFIKMEKTGGDILKVAAMANSEQDTYNLLEGAAAYCQLKYHQPIVAIAMGEEGQVSRICAGDFGSVMTYACGSKPTAPGQFDAKRLYEYMKKYYSKEGL